MGAPNDPAKKCICFGLENLEVERGDHAKNVVNSRTGTLVISGNVKVTPAAVSPALYPLGSMKIKI